MRRYAKDDAGKLHLLDVECDHCGARAKPGAPLKDWSLFGWDNGPGTDKHYIDSCAACDAKEKP